MPLSTEDRALLALHLVPGIGPRLLAAMLQRFGTAQEALHATPAELSSVPHLSAKTVDKLVQAFASSDVDRELDLMQGHGVRFVKLGDDEYPASLANTPGAPRLLFVRGALSAITGQAIAIVGSRTCTTYGRRIAERLATDLALAGFTIVSGLARGIDACAHRGALAAPGKTVAVLAGGLAKIYPPEHAELAEQVAANGALITESTMRMAPMPGMFPARNRIISGLCRGVVVVEAHEKSGALITARLAGEQGREVFVVPGPVDHPANAGSLMLLRQGATLVRHAQDILEDLQGISPLEGEATPKGIRPSTPAPLPTFQDATQRAIWEALDEPCNVDHLSRHVGLPIGPLSGVLMNMELAKMIRRLPGNNYERW